MDNNILYIIETDRADLKNIIYDLEKHLFFHGESQISPSEILNFALKSDRSDLLYVNHNNYSKCLQDYYESWKR